MRFLIGLLIGLGLGFAVTVVFGSNRSRDEAPEWKVTPEGELELVGGDDHGTVQTLRQALRSLRERVDEALAEAKQAQAEAEREMESRFRRATRKTVVRK